MRRITVTLPVLFGIATLAAAPAAFAESSTAGRSLETMRQRSEEIATTYLQRWSSGNGRALADVQSLYGPRVSFHGDFIDQRRLFDQKRRFGQRWPLRRYEHRPGTMRTSCDAVRQACLVRSIIDWQAASPARHAFSSGSSSFEMGIGFSGPRPAVLFERSRVLSYGGRHHAQAW